MPSDGFSELAFEYAPWSLSKAELAKNCSFKFQLQYVKRVKAKVPIRSAAARIGTAAHEVLEEYSKQSEHDPAFLKRALLRGAVKNELTTPEIEDLLALAHNIVRFRQRLMAICKKTAVKQILVEHRFGLTADMKPTGFWNKEDVFFRGVWDLVLLTAGGFAAIIDHKSGQPPATPEDVKTQNRTQLNIYAASAILLFPDLKNVRTALHFVQSEEIIWDKARPVEEIREKLLPWYQRYINTAAAEAPKNEARKGWYCAFCGYTDICPLTK